MYNKGKEKCERLKKIRRQIAKANGIDYEPSECTFEGECNGTCPKCDAELKELDAILSQKEALGEDVCLIYKDKEGKSHYITEEIKELESDDYEVSIYNKYVEIGKTEEGLKIISPIEDFAIDIIEETGGDISDYPGEDIIEGDIGGIVDNSPNPFDLEQLLIKEEYVNDDYINLEDYDLDILSEGEESKDDPKKD